MMGFSDITDQELDIMISEVDESGTGAITFADFLKLIDNQKKKAFAMDEEKDALEAFIACGGNSDGTGVVERSALTRIIKVDFGLELDVDDLLDVFLGQDASAGAKAEVDYQGFKALLKLE